MSFQPFERVGFTNSLNASWLSTAPIIFDNDLNLIFCFKGIDGDLFAGKIFKLC